MKICPAEPSAGLISFVRPNQSIGEKRKRIEKYG